MLLVRGNPAIFCLLVGLLIALSGCTVFDGTVFGRDHASPPSRSVGGSGAPVTPRQAVVVVGHFRNPVDTPLGWEDIGSGMGSALARTLSGHDRFEVRENTALANRVAAAARGTATNVDALFARDRLDYPDVDFVVTGNVTDFHHTYDLPEEYSRRGVFGSRKNDAIAAVDLRIVDLRTGRVAVSDHIVGRAGADKQPTDHVYKGMHFDSYLFWNAPLGKASKDVIEKIIRRIDILTPQHVAEVEILRMRGWRNLDIAGGSDHGIQRGQRYYVCVRKGTELSPVLDESLGTPLRAQIVKTNDRTSTAWLMGEPPVDVNLTGAVLTRELGQPLTHADE